MRRLLTNQEAFDLVYRHLLTQNERSESLIEKGVRCVYRSTDGKKCAAGILIEDDQYRPDMEGVGITWFKHQWLPQLRAVNDELLSRLQDVHDRALVEDWELNLRHIASCFHLTVPTL